MDELGILQINIYTKEYQGQYEPFTIPQYRQERYFDEALLFITFIT